MAEIVRLVAETVDGPLCLDSSNPLVLEAGLKAAPGKALVNSVSGEEKRLSAILSLVKDYGAAVTGLILDDSGIPATPEARPAVAEKVINRAAQMGIPQEDVVIDPAKMTGIIQATDLLLGKDEYAARYIKYYRQQQALLTQAVKQDAIR